MSQRGVRTFNHVPTSSRRRHTHMQLPTHDSSRFGGRLAYMREIGPINNKYRGKAWKGVPELQQYNVDVWCAQQTLRKKWKARDWEVMEVPFEKAPKVLQRVIPEKYTELPVMTDPKNGDFENIQTKVFDREELQDALYPHMAKHPFPRLLTVNRSAATLDTFLE